MKIVFQKHVENMLEKISTKYCKKAAKGTPKEPQMLPNATQELPQGGQTPPLTRKWSPKGPKTQFRAGVNPLPLKTL